MIASLLSILCTLEHKTKHIDLGTSEGLKLTVDLDIDIEYSDPYRFLQYKAHFYAVDSQGTIVNEKLVNLGETTNNPREFIVEDRFKKGYKQLFISLHCGGTQSYLFGFKDQKFYTAFINNQARVAVEVLPGKNGTWRLRESEAKKWAGHIDASPNVRVTRYGVYTTWMITPNSKPIVKIQYPSADAN